MIDYIFDDDENPMNNVTINLGTDRPLYQYVIKALKSLEMFLSTAQWIVWICTQTKTALC